MADTRPLASLLLVAATAGCIAATPVVIKGNDTFVTVSQPEHSRKSASTEVARDYCRQRGRSAVFLTDVCPQGACAERAITYWCH